MMCKSLAFMMLWSFLIPGVLHAGPVQLPQTGQQTCWNTGGLQISCSGAGQDGDLQKGEVWPAPRFTDQGQTITDNLTNLIWTKDAQTPGTAACEAGSAKTWQEALDHVKCLNSNSYLGYNDWRLPNINELESLVNYERNYPDNSDQVLSVAEWLMSASQGFTAVQGFPYWSSSSVVATPPYPSAYAWVINMYAGYLQSAKKVDVGGYVWPVRTALKPDLAIARMAEEEAGPFNRVITLDAINIGTASAAGVPVAFYHDGPAGKLLCQKTIASLAVQEVQSVVCEWDVTGIPVAADGKLTAYGVINREQTVSEKTHLNNSAVIQLPGAYPAIASSPSIPDKATGISTRPILDWGAVSGAVAYDLYLWEDGEAKPAAPTIAGLSAGSIKVWPPLVVSSLYHWQVVAKNISGQTAGPEWSFTTRAFVTGDINGDGQVTLADAVLSLSVQIRKAVGNGGIRSDYAASGVDVGGNRKIGLEETIYILQEVAEIR